MLGADSAYDEFGKFDAAICDPGAMHQRWLQPHALALARPKSEPPESVMQYK
jgi:hypothetical protein